MAQIDTQSREAASPPAFGDGFDEIHEDFRARLRDDRVHFVVLSAALARTDDNPALIFDDMMYRARRLKTIAAIFDVNEVAAAAGALEQAAASASQDKAENTDAAVWGALVTLVRLMGDVNPTRTRPAGLDHAAG